MRVQFANTKRFRTILFALIIYCADSSAIGQEVGIFADPDGTNCTLTATPGEWAQGYLVVKGVAGVQGVELSIEGLPAAWQGLVDFCGGCTVVLPDVFGSGSGYAWPDCRSRTIVPVLILATTLESEVVLTVAPSKLRIEPYLGCPVVALCDSPVFTRVCVAGLSTPVNGSEGCPVAVESLAWSVVKGLYR
jgi:hypothetical protein